MEMNKRAIPVADAHCDFLYRMTYDNLDIATPDSSQAISLPAMRNGGVRLQFFAAWVDMLLSQNPLSQCLNMIDSYYRMLESNPELVPFTADFDPTGNKIGTVLTVEGGEAIEGSLANLRMLYKLGVRAMTLTWNDVNSLAYPSTKKAKRGLSDRGKSVVREMCRIGMAVDLAHLNDAGIDDVLDIATRPVFSSHTNARSICPHPRCMNDEHIREISKQGGVIGVNFYYKQLTDKRNAEVSDVLRHIEHIINIGGVQCCALGSDFDGMNRYIEGLEDSCGFTRIAEGLMHLGLSDTEIQRIMYLNLADYIKNFV